MEYFVSGQKRRVAGSTKATSDYLAFIHKSYPTLTIRQMRELITDRTRCVPIGEAIEVLDAHIKVGYGDCIPDGWR